MPLHNIRAYNNYMFSFIRKSIVCSRMPIPYFISRRYARWSSFTTFSLTFRIAIIYFRPSGRFIVVWICISLITNDVDPLFMCIFVIYISSLVKCLFCVSSVLWLNCLLLLLGFEISPYSLYINRYRVCDLQIFLYVFLITSPCLIDPILSIQCLSFSLVIFFTLKST